YTLVLSMVGINILLIFGFTQTGFAQKRIQQVFGYTYANGYKHEDGKKKLLQWSSAIGANDNIVFGNGMGDAKTSILNEYEERGYSYYLKNNYNAHNQYLELYVGLGLLGLFSLLLILRQGFILVNKGSFGLYKILFLILPIAFLTESYLERHHGLVIFVLVYASIIFFSQDSK